MNDLDMNNKVEIIKIRMDKLNATDINNHIILHFHNLLKVNQHE